MGQLNPELTEAAGPFWDIPDFPRSKFFDAKVAKCREEREDNARGCRSVGAATVLALVRPVLIKLLPYIELPNHT